MKKTERIMQKTERIMHHAPRSATRASRARTAVCNRYDKFVTGRNTVSVTVNSVINQLLRLVCNMCSTFSEFILALVLNTVLFSKKNFNLKTPATHATHCGTTINPHFSCGTSATHGATQVLQTPSYLLHTKNIELNVNRKSRISGTMSTNMEIDQRYTSLRVLAPPK